MVSVAVIVTSCSTDKAGAPRELAVPDVRAMVTPTMTARLSDRGQFLALSTPLDFAVADVISSDVAADLAEKYVRVFGPFLRHPWEDQHGSRIDFAALKRGPRVVRSDSPIGATPADAGRSALKAWGPYYLVDLLGPGETRRTMTVGVSVYASDIEITERGIQATGPWGNEFRVWVAGPADIGEPRMSPEEAVRVAYLAFGARIRSVPTFVRVAPDVAPEIGRWRLELEHPVPMQNLATARRVLGDVVFVDRDGRLEIASKEETRGGVLRYVSTATGRVATAATQLRPGLALSFDPVTP
ncbi:MAG: hypothetical protein U9Q74_05370 [Gemmatimonadota bacterium]|nr:hypothetical protein [Gemmatimonadota bacterium]